MKIYMKNNIYMCVQYFPQKNVISISHTWIVFVIGGNGCTRNKIHAKLLMPWISVSKGNHCTIGSVTFHTVHLQ